MLDSPAAWDMLLRMYNAGLDDNSFLDYFWSWRSLLAGMYSVLQAKIPPARVYHAISTGYAGLLAARARLEKGRPAIVTEHGIYTNERRIEMAMADWLHDSRKEIFRLDGQRRTLKDVWVDTFVSYSRVCYEASSEVITLYGGNQQFQIHDGASPEKLRIIPNGVDYERYAAIRRDSSGRPPTVALVGRVVPIKDVRTFIRAVALLRSLLSGARGLVIGPTEEHREYFEECEKLVNHLGLNEAVEFTGRVKLDDYLGKIDVIVLTSISEAQPLVILEAGAAGLPVVATDVGACREMVLGRPDENPPLGAGGAITRLSDPSATARELAGLLTDREWYESASRAISERVRLHYNKTTVDTIYRDLYEKHRTAPSVPEGLRANQAWPA
jgi:glycosyltransferase involved in cell wall biosynthesis